jgi:hypothetical protein
MDLLPERDVIELALFKCVIALRVDRSSQQANYAVERAYARGPALNCGSDPLKFDFLPVPVQIVGLETLQQPPAVKEPQAAPV